MNRFESITKPLMWFMALLLTALVVGCNSGSNPILGGGGVGAGLKSIAVTPATSSIPITGFQQFTATATYNDGSTRVVTAGSNWNSGSPGVATISPTTGVAVGVTTGTSTITATYTVGAVTKTATAALTVNTATSVLFVVKPATASISIGGTQQFVAIETFSDGSTQDRTAASAWSTSGASAANATVGAATGLATGVTVTPVGPPAVPVVINARYPAVGGVLATPANLTVTAATSVSFKVVPITASIPVGGTQQFAAIETFSDGTTQDRTAASAWTTSGASASNATVGAATGLATGVTVTPVGPPAVPVIINARYPAVGGVLATPANLTVTAATSVSFKVTPVTASVAVGGTLQFAAIESFSDGTTQDRTTASAWTTSGTSAANATVGSNTGLATGVTVTPVGPPAVPVVINARYPAIGGILATPAALTVTAAGAGPGPAGAAPILGTAAAYGIIASTSITASPATHIFGDVAVTANTVGGGLVGFTPLFSLPNQTSNVVTDSTGTTPGIITATDNGNIAAIPQLQTDLQTAYNDNKWGSPTRVPPGVVLALPKPAIPSAGGTFPAGVVDLGGMVLGPGIYAVGAAANTYALSTSLVLDAEGNPDAVFVFQANDITTTTGDVVLINGAQAKNVFWVMTQTATLGTNSFFQGTIVTGAALTVNTGASVQGRMLASANGGAALTVSGAVITVPK